MIDAEVLVESKQWKKIIQNPKRIVLNILSRFPIKYKFINKKVYISILLTNNKKIKLLNNKFRKKNKATDILSFPLKKKISKNIIYLGDIIISYDFMNKPKSLNILEFKIKVVKIFIHGFLHLIGFNHIKDTEFKKMNEEELKIYNLVKKKFENFA